MASSAYFSSNIALIRILLLLLLLPFMLIFFLSFFSSTSVLAVGSSPFSRGNEGGSEVLKQTKTVLGSRPPKCINKCFNCKPCMAALVTPPHHKKASSSSSRGDESYYLLAWKCKCGNKYFQP